MDLELSSLVFAPCFLEILPTPSHPWSKSGPAPCQTHARQMCCPAHQDRWACLLPTQTYPVQPMQQALTPLILFSNFIAFSIQNVYVLCPSPSWPWCLLVNLFPKTVGCTKCFAEIGLLFNKGILEEMSTRWKLHTSKRVPLGAFGSRTIR